ncbi:hypothetical protein CHS0354_017774 [Potamilus streckersoni]|uniref:GCS light chain n=1 Tax=Potamilus streckersoni TaxID=2493646 RepID=A0AAE0T9K5_9BIVA|nr:hypothetical protein CHS0354_017774 [Potamilus streckersoni]
MADEVLLIPKANTLLVHSGNIVNWNRLKRKPNQTPTEEITECVGSTLAKFLAESDKNQLQYETDLDCVNAKFQETLPADERDELKVTVKIFLCKLLPPDALKEIVDRALTELGVSFVETVLISLPEQGDGEELTLDSIKPYWEVLQGLVQKEQVLSLGISDLDKGMLEQLYQWAQIKPVIDQVNLESCCVIPKDLGEFAKQHDIQLLTHNDPKNIMPEQILQEVIAASSTYKDGSQWETHWVLRYSVLIKCRGIIRTKGYILKAIRDLKKRK